MSTKLFLPLALAGSLLLSGCQSVSAQNTDAAAVNLADMFTDRDLEIGYDEQTAARITLNDTTAESDSDAVTVTDGTVTISDEGTYILSGSLNDGMVLVDAEDTDKVQLVLDGASIACADCAALYIRQADKVFVTTAANTANTLTGGETFVQLDDNNIDGAIFSKSDLTLNGQGTLTISSPGGHGVVTKDDLVITSGSYVVTAASHGLSGKDSVRIADGTLTLTTGKDGIQSDNADDTEKGFVYLAGGDLTIDAQGDGCSASSWMYVDDVCCSVTTGGGSANGETHTSDAVPGGGMPGQGGERPEGMERPANDEMPQGMESPMDGARPENMEQPSDSAIPNEAQAPAQNTPAATDDTQTAETTEDTVSAKGLKAGGDLTINSGTFTLDCADDAFHANGNLTFASGTTTIQSGDDAFHADSTLSVQSGTIDIVSCYEGLEGLRVAISGGNISIVASDDGINAAGGADQSGFGGLGTDHFDDSSEVLIDISSSNLTIDAKGDGIDSNQDIRISGGVINISTPTGVADFALDYDGSASITGGTLIGTGAASMAQNFGDSSTQGSILLTVGAQQADSTVSVADSDGNVLASWTPTHEYETVILSCAGLQTDGTYTVTAGGNTTEITLDGLLYGESLGRSRGMSGGRSKDQMAEPPQSGNAPAKDTAE